MNNTKRTHIVIPDELVNQIDQILGKRGRSSFLVQAAEKELQRLQQMKALMTAAGSWDDKDHPELKKAPPLTSRSYARKVTAGFASERADADLSARHHGYH